MQNDVENSVKSAEYCLARADENERLAAKAEDARNKAMLQELANRWRRLAADSRSDAFKPVGGQRPAP
ncbi:MAG TPA: hypothetical protein VME45_07360 [Stellaceae bacterium]|nr:hypothetical protein [Stellaceae bacterium]